MVRQLVNQLRHAIVVALLDGGGTTEPLGIIGTTGVGNQSGTTLAWSGVIEMARLVEATGPLSAGRASWVVGSSTAKLLRTREVAAGAGLILDNVGRICGYPARVTSAMPADALLFGDFGQVVLAEWGALEIGRTLIRRSASARASCRWRPARPSTFASCGPTHSQNRNR